MFGVVLNMFFLNVFFRLPIFRSIYHLLKSRRNQVYVHIYSENSEAESNEETESLVSQKRSSPRIDPSVTNDFQNGLYDRHEKSDASSLDKITVETQNTSLYRSKRNVSTENWF